jgi:hypothetical protein
VKQMGFGLKWSAHRSGLSIGSASPGKEQSIVLRSGLLLHWCPPSTGSCLPLFSVCGLVAGPNKELRGQTSQRLCRPGGDLFELRILSLDGR